MRFVRGAIGPGQSPLVAVRIQRTVDAAEAVAGASTEIRGYAVVDTGAEMSAISASVAERLGIIPTTTIEVGGIDGLSRRPVYRVSLFLELDFDTSERTSLASAVTVVEATVSDRANLTGPAIVALLGMDILDRCTLYVYGPDHSFVFGVPSDQSDYDRPPSVA